MHTNRNSKVYDSCAKMIRTANVLSDLEIKIRYSEDVERLCQYIKDNSSVILKFHSVYKHVETLLDNALEIVFSSDGILDLHTFATSLETKIKRIVVFNAFLDSIVQEAESLDKNLPSKGSHEIYTAVRKFETHCRCDLDLDDITDRAKSNDFKDSAIPLSGKYIDTAKDLEKAINSHAKLMRNVNNILEDVDNSFFYANYDISLNVLLKDLQEYISMIPHPAKDDINEVRGIINMADKIKKELEKLCKTVEVAKDYPNRYHRTTLFAKRGEMLSLAKIITYEGASSFLNRLKDENKIVNSLLEQTRNNLSDEKRQLQVMQAKLSNGASPNNIWENDRTLLVDRISEMLSHSSKDYKADLDYGLILKNLKDAENKRKTEIEGFITRYPWLERSKKYSNYHSQLCQIRNLSYEMYQNTVKRMESYRTEKITLWCIPVLGWLIICIKPEFKI